MQVGREIKHHAATIRYLGRQPPPSLFLSTVTPLLFLVDVSPRLGCHLRSRDFHFVSPVNIYYPEVMLCSYVWASVE